MFDAASPGAARVNWERAGRLDARCQGMSMGQTQGLALPVASNLRIGRRSPDQMGKVTLCVATNLESVRDV